MKRFLGSAMLATIVAVVGAQEVGILSYAEGDVKIVREGLILTSDGVGLGGALVVSDVIQTGVDAFAEIALTGADVATATLRIDENSAYYLEIHDRTSGTDTRIRLLHGSVRVAVEGLPRGRRLSVQTPTAVLGVRGTEFDVLLSPDEATLLGVREGTVELSAAGGNVRADAGNAVEALASGAPVVARVPGGDFQAYYDDWRELRRRIFRNGAPVFVAAYARRYDDLLPTFETAFDDLIRFRDDLEQLAKTPGSTADDIQIKMAMGPALTRMRSVQPLFENVVYRLRDLRRYHEEGIGVTSFDGVDSGTFFTRFELEETLVLSKLSVVRHIFSLYNQIDRRGFGDMPGGALPEGLERPFGGGAPPSMGEPPTL